MRQFTVICIPFFFQIRTIPRVTYPQQVSLMFSCNCIKRTVITIVPFIIMALPCQMWRSVEMGQRQMAFQMRYKPRQTNNLHTFHIMIIFNKHQFINMWTIAIVVFYSAFWVAWQQQLTSSFILKDHTRTYSIAKAIYNYVLRIRTKISSLAN